MNVAHLVAGYDKRTERLLIEHGIPAAIFAEIKAIAEIPDTDRDALGSYPLSESAARRIGATISAMLDTAACDWFLEPVAE